MQFQLGSGIPSRNPTEEERDRARAVGVRQGDRSAFEALYRFYYEPLCDYVEYNIGDGNEAEDIVQNIFLRIWMKKRNVVSRNFCSKLPVWSGKIRDHKYVAQPKRKA